MALGRSFLDIIVGIIVPLVTAAGVFLGPYLAETLRRRHERHREQMLEFKRYVLTRLRELLEEHYLAILRNERPSVGVFTENIPRKEAHVGEWAEKPEESLKVVGPSDEMHSPGVPNYFHGVESKEAEEPKSLWRDARRTFRAVFQLWDEFIKDFGVYQQTCLSEVNRLYTRIAAAQQIPEYSPLTIMEPPWVNARGLAWYAFFRSFRLQSAPMPLVLSQDGTLFKVNLVGTPLAIVTKQQAETYLSLVETLLQTPTGAIDKRQRLLLARADTLHEDVQRPTL